VESFDNCQFQTHAFVLPPLSLDMTLFVFVNVTFSPSAYPRLLHVEVCQEVYENLQELCVRANIRRAKMLEKSSSLVLFVCFFSFVPAPLGNSSKRKNYTNSHIKKKCKNSHIQGIIYTCVCANAHVYRAGGDNIILTCKYFGIMLILYLLPIGVLALIEACFCIETEQNSRLTCRYFSAPSMSLKNYEFRGCTHAQAWPGTEASKSLLSI